MITKFFFLSISIYHAIYGFMLLLGYVQPSLRIIGATACFAFAVAILPDKK